MINKKLIAFDRGAMRFVGANVAFQWLGMLCNVVLVMTVSRLIGGVFAGSLTGNALWQGMLLCLLTVPVRYGFTLCASDMSDRASKDVKRTLRSSIYAKLTRLGAGYSETVATSEAVMLASEGVEQIDTYFAKYLPQLFYSLLAPVTLFVLLVGVHARSAILLLCCVPLIPLSIVAVQKFAKKLLANYWGEYTTLGDSFLENIQGLTTLKIYQADGWKHEEMNAQAERFRKITMKVLTMQLNSVTLMDLMAYGGAGLGIISAASAFAKGQLSLTSALTILLLAADFFLPLRLLGSYFHIAMNGAASAEKIFRLLSAQEPEDGEKTADPADSTLALEHVTFGYEKERTILHDVSLTIPQGSFVSLVGESGCGKSTIAALLSGSRTGYTGELGFELYFDVEKAGAMWDRLLEVEPVKPAGLGARDTLRLEMGYSLYGHELTPEVTPLDVGAAPLLKLAEQPGRDFVGRAALEKAGVRRRLIGIGCLLLRTSGKAQGHSQHQKYG